ncbi:hypothetical protein [Hyphomicrobium sp.]|uniref:hypothetical protein n=1 Tax=Hyphomicrobium sp. TaxID=82 RepID=UPI001DDA9477|nr:hypothetical protein [Hyphomicrobium sp.]MBY0559839.1 hypothetical protein [Hyphomicrobium sp.]
MKIKDFLIRGRELYAVCHGNHGFLGGARRIPIDLSDLDPEMDHEELRGKLRCTVCGTKDPRTILLIKQTDRQMRQGRQR